MSIFFPVHFLFLVKEAAYASTTETAQNGGITDAGREWLCCQKPLAGLMPQKAAEPRVSRPQKMISG